MNDDLDAIMAEHTRVHLCVNDRWMGGVNGVCPVIRLAKRTRDAEAKLADAVRNALHAYADAVQENESATHWTADQIAADVRKWAGFDQHQQRIQKLLTALGGDHD